MTSPPAMKSMQDIISASSFSSYGTYPKYSAESTYTIMALPQTSSASTNWQMTGYIGTSKKSWGGKTWPTFYYSFQVAYYGARTGGSVVQ